ncbi:DUF3458 domain-containing protein, partial [Candidatus Peregrinibacteria bacterium]|nr:DUF3458 domain-containing protein [Candidatus Peregrinibacteria bacterium]
GSEIKEVTGVWVDGVQLKAGEFVQKKSSLSFSGKKDPFTVKVGSIISPLENQKRRGLYKSGDLIITQNESEGFRDIIPFPDRPDILTSWRTEVTASKEIYPVMLATGNLVSNKENADAAHPARHGALASGSHTSVYQSELHMPCYLFAMALGKMDVLVDKYTLDGHEIKLQIFTAPGKTDRAAIAMESLKMSLQWDFDNYGRRYPLDQYSIVCADDFNFGAMENLGLNIFNSASAISSPETGTDETTVGIAVTVAHEYCHTWRGDLVTVRTWHEAALKEGFVRLMDCTFEGELVGESVARIRTVRNLRSSQFTEDAGNSAHQIWPEEYKGDPGDSIYTSTTYSKGAEVVRMVKTLVGKEKFRAGLDLYFEKFYGKAATIDDLVSCLAAASGRDLTQFKQWFMQVGTPTCAVTSSYDEASGNFTLNVAHECPREPKYALNFPLQMGLIGPEGKVVKLELMDGGQIGDASSSGHDLARGVLNITKNQQTFVFKNVPKGSVSSLFRELSAPMKYTYNYSTEELRHLMKYDDEGFNRYEAGQRIVNMEMDKLAEQYRELVRNNGSESPPTKCRRESENKPFSSQEAAMDVKKLTVDEETLKSFDAIVYDLMDTNPAVAREMLILPGEKEFVQKMEVYDFQAAKAARDALQLEIAKRFKDRFVELYKKYRKIAVELEEKKSADGKVLVINKEAMLARRIKNTCLAYLATLANLSLDTKGEEFIALAEAQFKTAKNMTDESAALKILSDNAAKSDGAMDAFYKKWEHEELVLQRWRSLLGLMDLDNVFEKVEAYTKTDRFDFNKPGHVMNLFGGFIANSARFHDAQGNGYRLVVDVAMKSKNPYAAARMLREAFGSLPKMDVKRQALMREQLERFLAAPGMDESPLLAAKKILEW